MRRPTVTPEGYRKITTFALVALVFIVVSGAAVRLTGSGLGCSDWPTCEENQLVAPLEYHAMVEFVNRTVTGLVSIAVVLAVLGSFWREPRRRDLVLLSWGLVAGVAAQIVLGGLTVLFELAPPFVMGHFLLSAVLVANAVILHHRARQPDGATRRLAVDRTQLRIGRAMVAAVLVTVVAGTVVTGAGPHGGDEEVERLDFAVPEVARVHGVLALITITLVVVGVSRARGRYPWLWRPGGVLAGVTLAQIAVGYTQYLTDVPELLVGIHVLGSMAVWMVVLWFHLELTQPVDDAAEPSAPPVATSELATSGAT